MKHWGDFPLGRWHVSWSLPSIPYPRVHWYWRDSRTGSLGVIFGTRGSDPIVAFDSPNWTPSPWLCWLLDFIAS